MQNRSDATFLTRGVHHEPRRDSCPQLSSRAKLDPVFAENQNRGAALRRTPGAAVPIWPVAMK